MTDDDLANAKEAIQEYESSFCMYNPRLSFDSSNKSMLSPKTRQPVFKILGASQVGYPASQSY
jgi:hypothetical protein